MRSFLLLICTLAAAFAARAEGVGATEGHVPFHIGERLVYVIKWGALPVGRAELAVLDGEPQMGLPAYLFQVSVRSYPVVDLFYKVRDRIESFTDRSMSHSLLYRAQQREGRHKRDVRVEFDWHNLKAHHFRKGEHVDAVTIVPGTFDPLGVFYAFRLIPLADDLAVEAPVTDGKKCVTGRARIIRRERIKVRAGEFDTYLVEPELEHVGGIFEKSKDAKLLLWVTADSRRIVVKAKSKVAVGHFVADLVSVEGDAEGPFGACDDLSCRPSHAWTCLL